MRVEHVEEFDAPAPSRRGEAQAAGHFADRHPAAGGLEQQRGPDCGRRVSAECPAGPAEKFDRGPEAAERRRHHHEKQKQPDAFVRPAAGSGTGGGAIYFAECDTPAAEQEGNAYQRRADSRPDQDRMDAVFTERFQDVIFIHNGSLSGGVI
ncbi:hypothetical protein SDC9_132251 [bioreactor metagenome]|uniref:Uncharacterized protein n=1 Tax=bioreactor metagenome TaxID=1076179 RepID=A0A645D8A4_9ZZZZ